MRTITNINRKWAFSKETVDGKSVIKIGNNTYVSTELKLE